VHIVEKEPAGDCVMVRCTVHVVEKEPADKALVASVRVPSPDLTGTSAACCSGTGSAPTSYFIVRGRAFHAHRCMLSARSPVLRTELYDEATMERPREAAAPSSSERWSPRPSPDSLPDTVVAVADDGIDMAQHLLAAADRFRLQRLSLTCQE
jgi:speckle-type POZ protein